jgi:hypothetical protein
MHATYAVRRLMGEAGDVSITDIFQLVEEMPTVT